MGEDTTVQNQTFLVFNGKFFWFKNHDGIMELLLK